ncbi:MAG: tRNA uridine-5-carboxymethylaminomethyl(34) synthesis GTPase MnmE [Endomicrobia bacterium]|nr:tRNA uridine-5-carboxymethylaminomethyl(34) synthesis GTPase MnmE [Endomicrobiia bacterium]MCX7716673.1 tRNA uridine-5-carboxymethylaminomethyl(34) synthesis GTPase MnmE [Endomicrobiia bacterium]
MEPKEDTIVAISTPFGTGGLGIVRLSGTDALKIAESIFRPKKKSKIISQLKSFTTHLGYIVDNETVIDEVLMTIMRAPHSYTCEDVVEFSCHGGIIVLQQVVELCIKHGARIAEPGEFTKRAFLNGRIDLTEAEAVCELINSKSELQNKIYTYSLLGKTKSSIQKIVNRLTEIIADLDVTIEYPQEDDVARVNYSKCTQEIKHLVEEISQAIEINKKITPILTGINVAIIGKVNVGKSSLLNILLNHDRAIVSELPGTTRDTISETINLNGYLVRIIDTAGIREHSQDPIEKIGIQRTKNAIEEADVILFLFDATKDISNDDVNVVNIVVETVAKTGKKILIPVVNKIDLPVIIFNDNRLKEILARLNQVVDLYPKFDDKNLPGCVIKISCVTKEGIKTLEHSIIKSQNINIELTNFPTQDAQPSIVVTNIRQKQLLEKAKNELIQALNININTSVELICEHLKNAVRELNRIVGGDITEDTLNLIFSRFCVGK